MAKKKHDLIAVDKLCAKSADYGGKVCKKRKQVGSSSRLGNFGKQTKARTPMFTDGGRRGIKNPTLCKSRAKLGKAAPSPTESVGYNVQAHHMISKKEYGEKKVFKFAGYCGHDIALTPPAESGSA